MRASMEVTKSDGDKKRKFLAQRLPENCTTNAGHVLSDLALTLGIRLMVQETT